MKTVGELLDVLSLYPRETQVVVDGFTSFNAELAVDDPANEYPPPDDYDMMGEEIPTDKRVLYIGSEYDD